jgi:hypothetical protein
VADLRLDVAAIELAGNPVRTRIVRRQHARPKCAVETVDLVLPSGGSNRGGNDGGRIGLLRPNAGTGRDGKQKNAGDGAPNHAGRAPN